MTPKPPRKRMSPNAAIWPALATVMLGSMVAIYTSTRDDERAATDTPAPTASPSAPERAAAPRAGFDFYLLAMTVHDSFCAERERKPECRMPQPKVLVIHGLWPERLEPRTYPHDCPAPRLALEPALARDLEPLMPGMADGLHEHEWREHGGCSGLDDDDYFRHTLDAARRVDAALGARLTSLAGRDTDAAQLRAAADEHERGLGATLTFHCRVPRGAASESRGRPWLFEVRQCLDDDGAGGAPSTTLDCATVNRRDQGCGARFFIPKNP